jgi:hypothetical protein
LAGSAQVAQPAQSLGQHNAVHEVSGDQRELPPGLVALRRRHGADRRHPHPVSRKPQQQPVPDPLRRTNHPTPPGAQREQHATRRAVAQVGNRGKHHLGG